VKIAVDNDYFLSFTGFSNGAWLAEHSLYYAHQDFNHIKSKAVLFDSPGMCKTEQELEETGIISEEKKFSLKDMNVVNYLTAPCFANSCNKHVGAVYRLFVNQEKFNNLNLIPKIIDHIKEWPALGWLVKKIEELCTNYKFFLIGLASMFIHGNIDLIVAEFDEVTGKPSYCEKVLKWPVVQLSFDNSFGANLSDNIENFTSERVEGYLKNCYIFNKMIRTYFILLIIK
jgi:hypothetical protein